MKEVAKKKKGDVFGEMANDNSSGKRSASIKCAQDCIFLVISGKDYNLYLRRQIDKVKDEEINFMRDTILFSNWSKSLMRTTNK